VQEQRLVNRVKVPPGGAAIFGLDDHQLATDRITVGEPVIRIPEVKQSKKASEGAAKRNGRRSVSR